MPESTATAVAEDVTEINWEDLALEMSDEAGPDELVSTSGCTGSLTLHSCSPADCHMG